MQTLTVSQVRELPLVLDVIERGHVQGRAHEDGIEGRPPSNLALSLNLITQWTELKYNPPSRRRDEQRRASGSSPLVLDMLGLRHVRGRAHVDGIYAHTASYHRHEVRLYAAAHDARPTQQPQSAHRQVACRGVCVCITCLAGS